MSTQSVTTWQAKILNVATAVCIIIFVLMICKSAVGQELQDKIAQYELALSKMDSVISRVVLVDTEQGARGLTRGEVDELRHSGLLIKAAIEELKVATAAPVEGATVPEKGK